MDLKKILKERRPNLSNSSITTYNSILRNLHRKVFDKDLEENDFHDTKAITAYLLNIPANRRKTILSALTVLTGLQEYREAMMNDIETYTQQIARQEKTETQQDNWLEPDVLQEKLEQHKKNASLLYRKKSLTEKDLQEIQNYILLVLYSGVYVPPRRAKDYVDFRIGKEIDKDKENYLDKGAMIFNSYKTSKKYGQQKVPLPNAMKTILKKWIAVNPTPYLLFDTNQSPLTSVKLNQRLNKIFGKKISVNALRHSYLSEKYGDIGDDLSNMGTSMNMVTTYVKK
tara:strand:- start:1894 stop:2748 length:855 start_codon:yes stop_codon:yes gene_type:complete